MTTLADDDALALAEADSAEISDLAAQACAVRDRAWGRRITYSPKVFLPVTNLCRNYCSYCAFRRSPGQPGEWTMTPDELDAACARAASMGCFEALLCLGDKPEDAFPSYRDTLRTYGASSTAEYLVTAAKIALGHGLLPHTNAGILAPDELRNLRPRNASFGLMLESTSDRLCARGGVHHRAPDKVPAVRVGMIAEAGRQGIPFTTGILLGIGETRRERVETLLEIRRLHRAHGHIQEVIVQNFRADPGTAMRHANEPAPPDVVHAVAMARLILDPEVSVQSPPNLNTRDLEGLLDAGINDLGGISPVTPDYVNPRHPWPQLPPLAARCAKKDFVLTPRLCVYDRFAERPEFVDPAMTASIRAARARLERGAATATTATTEARP